MHLALEDSPVLFPPGRGFEYSNPGFAVLSQVLAVALQGSAAGTLPDFLRNRVFLPIGVEDREWSIGYDQPFETERIETELEKRGLKVTVKRLPYQDGDLDGTRKIVRKIVDAWSFTERMKRIEGDSKLSGKTKKKV